MREARRPAARSSSSVPSGRARLQKSSGVTSNSSDSTKRDRYSPPARPKPAPTSDGAAGLRHDRPDDAERAARRARRGCQSRASAARPSSSTRRRARPPPAPGRSPRRTLTAARAAARAGASARRPPPATSRCDAEQRSCRADLFTQPRRERGRIAGRRARARCRCPAAGAGCRSWAPPACGGRIWCRPRRRRSRTAPAVVARAEARRRACGRRRGRAPK